MKAATWSSDEVAVLVSNQHLTNTEVASMLPARTVSAVNNQRKLRGIVVRAAPSGSSGQRRSTCSCARTRT
jgi:hypothetical protein